MNEIIINLTDNAILVYKINIDHLIIITVNTYENFHAYSND